MNHTVLVTGSSRGIGRAIAMRLARDGFDIVLHCRQHVAQAEEVRDAIVTLGCAARVLSFDVADRTAAAAAIDADIAAHGAYHGIVCNAGLARDAVFPAMTGEEWDQVLRTDLDGFYNVVKPALLPMIRARNGGRIVAIASASGQIGNRGQVNYSAAKAGLIGATKALALELASRGITVNCVAPGLIESDMTRGIIEDRALIDAIPMRRAGRAEDVAAAVAWVVSPDSAYVTRQVLAVNGGLC